MKKLDEILSSVEVNHIASSDGVTMEDVKNEIIEYIRNEKMKSADEIFTDLHDSIVGRRELVLGDEIDTAFNYGRVHLWLDQQRKHAQELGGDTE